MADERNKSSKEDAGRQNDAGAVSWGPRLFLAVFVGILAFFYWLLIYSGGVTGHQG